MWRIEYDWHHIYDLETKRHAIQVNSKDIADWRMLQLSKFEWVSNIVCGRINEDNLGS